jgi:RimJ/RimL family protein N-acetyltransferase
MQIETQRLVLRPLGRDDDDAYAGLGEELAGESLTTEDACGEVNEAADHWAEHDFGPWGIRERGSERVIGALVDIHFAGEGIGGIDPGEVEIGWMIAADRCGTGMATEAARAAIADAFARWPTPHLVAYIRPENTASLRIAAKLGMRDKGDGTTKSGDRMGIFRLPRPTTIEPA